ncbi:MAG: hypothetical protein RLZZ529_282 [Bacteroidota bacterium]|jgi:hypothetical protein
MKTDEKPQKTRTIIILTESQVEKLISELIKSTEK